METDQWARIFSGDVDIIFGSKGSGKSALYSLLIARKDELQKKGIQIITAENLRGIPAFADLVDDPPTTEREFIGLWKLYFISLVGQFLLESECRESRYAQEVINALQQVGLIKEGFSLKTILLKVFGYARSVFRPEAIEGEIKVDHNTGLPLGFGGKITFRESAAGEKSDLISVDNLLGIAQQALAECKKSAWILLDRLDVAFADAHDLEENALRALFHVYLDLLAYPNIRPKIFLRTDIMASITRGGFREASHITRYIYLTWDRQSLLNLIIKRVLQNPGICAHYKIDAGRVLASLESQTKTFYRIFPRQIDVGQRMPQTFDWMVSRVTDGTGQTAPRELIHLLIRSREEQLRLMELGNHELEGETLFSRSAIKQSLEEVSRVRLEQTIFAEYPDLRGHIESLARAKTQQHIKSLARIWDVPENEARGIAKRLVEVGLFERRETKAIPEAYRVPFLYRQALQMIQGTAD